MSLSTMQTLPFEGHNVAQCKDLDQSCEDEVNLSTNEMFITEKQNLSQIVKELCWISMSSKGQGHDATCWSKGVDLSKMSCSS